MKPTPTRRFRVSSLAGLFLLSVLWLLAGVACAGETDTAAEAETTEGDAAEGAPAEPFDVSTLPEVVATVGEREITRDELSAEAQGARGALLQNGVPMEQTQTEEFYRQALDQIIAGILLFDEARTEGLVPSDEEVERQITAMRQQVPEGQSFEAVLARQGSSVEQLREEMRMNAALQQIIDTKIAPGVEVTEEQARAFYDENLSRMQKPARVKVRHILLKTPAAEEGSKEEVRKKAEDLRSQITSGADFAALAREHSQDQVSQQQGGDLPWILQGQTVPAFEQAAFGLNAGELSPVVETQFGFHVIEGVAREDATTASFEEVRPRILSVLRQEQARERLHAHVEGLKETTPVEIRFGDDEAS